MLFKRKAIWTLFIVMTISSFALDNTFARVVDVSIIDFAFEPANVTIEVGDSVRWTNNGALTHTTTSDANPPVWDSGNMSPGETFIFEFTSNGSFGYLCTIHPSMTGTVEVQPATGIEDEYSRKNAPVKFSLNQNYPNPFNKSTVIEYSIDGNSTVNINIAIYNIQGKKIIDLVNGKQYPGEHHVKWKGVDYSGNEVSSGVYLYRLKSEGYEQVKRIAFLK